jgi:hypothetical protein
VVELKKAGPLHDLFTFALSGQSGVIIWEMWHHLVLSLCCLTIAARSVGLPLVCACVLMIPLRLNAWSDLKGWNDSEQCVGWADPNLKAGLFAQLCHDPLQKF